LAELEVLKYLPSFQYWVYVSNTEYSYYS